MTFARSPLCVTQCEQQFINCLRQASIFAETPNSVPMPIAEKLADFFFTCQPRQALLSLRRKGYLDFDGFERPCTLRRTVEQKDVDRNTEYPNVPSDRALRAWVDAWRTTSQFIDLTAADDEEEEKGHPPASSNQPIKNEKGVRVSPLLRSYLSDHALCERIEGKGITLSVSVRLAEMRWPQTTAQRARRHLIRHRLLDESENGDSSLTIQGQREAALGTPSMNEDRARTILANAKMLGARKPKRSP